MSETCQRGLRILKAWGKNFLGKPEWVTAAELGGNVVCDELVDNNLAEERCQDSDGLRLLRLIS